MEKLDGMSLDIEYTEKEKLKSIFPQCFVEGKLDVQKLLDLCGEYELKDFERYEFTWHGKSECLKNAQTRSKGTLRPCIVESKNFDNTQNLYIEGDNLEVLKLLQTSYYNKVKMIYIDPPYNTGKDFIYPDNFTDSLANYKEITSQATKSNPETMGRFHTDWLNMIYPRLRLAYNLLKDDGVIFISIDDNEVHNLRKVCDEVFGEENFVSELIWERAYSPKNDAKYISNSHDYVLMYAKKIDEFEIGRLERTDEANARYRNPDNDPRGDWKPGDLSVKTYNSECDYPITTPSGRVVEPPTGRCWRQSKEAFQKNVDDNRIWFGIDGNSVPQVKRFLTELKFEGMAPQSIMFYKQVGHSQEGAKEVTTLLDAGAFDGPKPTRLLNRLLTLANINKEDLILDFFSGSATTAHAVMDLNAQDGGNRKFILVQLPELCEENTEAYKNGYKNICEIGKERIRRAGSKIEEEINEYNQQLKIGDEEKQMIDTGFKVFKLDTSNVKVWDNTPLEKIEEDKQLDMFTERLNSMVEAVKNDRTDLDLVYEILLKEGIELTETIIPQDFNGKQGYIVREDALLIICLDKDLKAEHVAEMVEYAPSTIVFAEDSFTNVDEIENAKIKVDEVLGFDGEEKVKFRFI